MTEALAITEMSMINSMNKLDTISHNLANTSTAGFKRDIPVSRAFSEQLEAGLLNTKQMRGLKLDSQQPVLATIADQTQGVFKYTGNALDLAIEGDGFFALATDHGTVYSRQGSLTVDASGRLSTSNGMLVQMLEGDVRLSSSEPRIDKHGRVWDNDLMVGQIELVKFSNLKALSKVGSGLFIGGDAQVVDESDAISVRQGFVETSNVNAMKEMVDLMSTMRQIEFNQKVLRGYDEMMDIAIRSIADVNA